MKLICALFALAIGLGSLLVSMPLPELTFWLVLAAVVCLIAASWWASTRRIESCTAIQRDNDRERMRAHLNRNHPVEADRC